MNKKPSSSYKVRFNDCDMFGHLNNARYLDYMINAREDHLKDNYNFDIVTFYQKNIGWVAASHEIIYLRPARYNEIVTIRSQLIQADTLALYVEIIMMDKIATQIKAALRTKLVPVNIKTGKKEPHTPELINWAVSLIDNESVIKTDFKERIKQLIIELRKQ